MAACGDDVEMILVIKHCGAATQTAHEAGYLVKHLIGGLPPVVERVRLMRKGQAPNGSMEDNFAKMAQSQVCYMTCSSLIGQPCDMPLRY